MISHSNQDTYIRLERVNRRTGSLIQVLDLCDARTEFEPGYTYEYDEVTGGQYRITEVARWGITCRTHGTINVTTTLSNAVRHAATPWEFCEECQTIVEGN